MTSTTKFRAVLLVLLLAGVVLGLLAGSVTAETVGDVVTSLRNRGVYFDSVRFPDSVVQDFVDDIQTLIATIGKTNHAESTYVLGSGYKYPVPSNFHQVWAGILNIDWDEPVSKVNRPYFLDYVPPERYGSVAFTTTDRPTSITVWGDSLLLDNPSYDDKDTVTLFYFALPTAVVADTSTVGVPAAYVPLVKEALEYMCINRVMFPGRSDKQETLALVNLLTQAILGREDDKNVP